MQLTQATASATRPSPAARQRIVCVDCIDAARRDVLVYWLTHAGYDVANALHDPHATHDAADGVDVLITDRFGPGLEGEVVIADLKARQPRLRVIIIGCGGAREPAQLSLARVAGADATLSSPFEREHILALLDQRG